MVTGKHDQHGLRIGFPLSFTVLFCSHMLIFAIPDEFFVVLGFNYEDWLDHLPEIVVSLIGDSAFPATTTLAFLTLPFVMALNLYIFGRHLLIDHWSDYLARRDSIQKDQSTSYAFIIFCVGALAPPIYLLWGIPNRAQFGLMPWFVPWESRVAAILGLSAGYSLFFVICFIGFLAELKVRFVTKPRG